MNKYLKENLIAITINVGYAVSYALILSNDWYGLFAMIPTTFLLGIVIVKAVEGDTPSNPSL